MDVRERILEAAAAIYGASGFHGATTRRIAQDAGVNEVTVFRHFGSKEALLREVIELGWKRFELPALPEHPVDPESEVTSWALRYYALHHDCAAFIRTRLGEFQEHPEIIPAAGSPPARMAALLAGYLTRLKDAGHVRAEIRPTRAAVMLIGAMFSDAVTREGLGDMYGDDAEDDVRGYVQMFLRGIGALP